MTVAVSSDVPAEAEPYLEAVRASLFSVPAGERAELLDDVVAQLRELIADGGPPLAARLGAPNEYASDLLTSAGYPPDAVDRPREWRHTLRRWWQETEALRPIREVLPLLWPGWWVVRPFLLAAGALAVVGGGRLADEIGGLLVALVVALLFVGTSIRWGQRGRLERSWLDRATTLAAVVAALVAMEAVASLPRHHFTDVSASSLPGYMTHADGTPISNIYAYGPDGKPVEVFLYDQAGRPIADLSDFDPSLGSLQTRFALDGRGQPISNLYPRQQDRIGPFVDSPTPVVPPSVQVPTRLSTTTSSSTTTPPPP